MGDKSSKESVRVLIIDDDRAITASLSLLLKQAGCVSTVASNPAQALALLNAEASEPDRAFCDMVFQDMNFSRTTTGEEGLQLLKQIKAKYPHLPVVLMTAWASVDLAVTGMKLGAADFITKPWTNEQVLQTVRTVTGLAEVQSRVESHPVFTRVELDSAYDLSGMVGADPSFLSILSVLARISATDAAVLITGESGTGKELAAEIVWRNSLRKQKPFIKVNLGGIPATLFESEMFGHVQGAFTDAKRDRTGRFESAHMGTIFLDEIGDLEHSSQVKLLRVLQDRTFEKVGSSSSQTVDVRIISATNRDIAKLISEGLFREDLFYRLNLISVHIPPLRERPADIPLLSRHCLEVLSAHYCRPAPVLDAGAVHWLSTQPWPGNIRQLKQLLERTMLLVASDRIRAQDLVLAAEMHPTEKAASQLPPPGTMTLDDMERKMIVETLDRFHRHITLAAQALGISRAALYRKMAKYGIES